MNVYVCCVIATAASKTRDADFFYASGLLSGFKNPVMPVMVLCSWCHVSITSICSFSIYISSLQGLGQLSLSQYAVHAFWHRDSTDPYFLFPEYFDQRFMLKFLFIFHPSSVRLCLVFDVIMTRIALNLRKRGIWFIHTSDNFIPAY